MLVPSTLFSYILNNSEYSSFPKINMRSVKAKRAWKNKSEEEKREFSAMRSRVQKQVYKDHPYMYKVRAENFQKVAQKYWDTIDEEKKQEHIQKMSDGMKMAWSEDDEEFGPRLAHIENHKKLNGNIEVIELDRVNDYCGVITSSQMAQLNG